MKTIALLAPVILSVIAATPSGAQTDFRVRTVAYQPNGVIVVSARPDFETMVSFAPDEKIENVAVGDSTSWQVAPNKRSDLLFVKPMTPDAHSNMAVVTDRRTYLFELRADDGSGPPVYSLRFSYPDTPTPPAAAAVKPVTITPWQASGSTALRPERTYDDGHSVFLFWPRNVALPALLAVDDKGVEEPLTFSARDDYLITDALPARIVVRVGDTQAVLVPQSDHAAAKRIAER